jgi:hypothetical protein
MTRSWTLSLTTLNTWYNLWTLISLDSIPDPTFTTSAYVPELVCELNITPNSAAVSISEDSKQEVGLAIPVAAAYIKRTTVNSIGLKNFSLRSATGGATVNVSISAL